MSFLSGPTTKTLRTVWLSAGVRFAGSPEALAGTKRDAQTQQAKLIGLCKNEGVRVIAVEPQYPDAMAKNLQAELGRAGVQVKIITLDPIETVPRDKLTPDLYSKKMRENIDTLAQALP